MISESNIVAAVLFASFITTSFVLYEFHQLKKWIKKQRYQHENWLFNQLYSMSPGKVLKPDETEEKVTNQPAKVVNPNKDPMNEFNGTKSDWF
ncbi:MAG: hypothetical protein AB7I27_00415 [Bacteriovoracaceae bacterium]